MERLLKKSCPGFALWNVMTVPAIWPDHSTKVLPNRIVVTTSEVALSTTLYVHIFAFDLVRALRYAVNSVAKESSLTQWSGASCVCTLNRLGSPGEYNWQKAGPLLVATEPQKNHLIFRRSDGPCFSGEKIMSLERELAALNRRLNDLKRRQEAIHMRVFTRNHDEPYPADARDGDFVGTIEPPLNWE